MAGSNKQCRNENGGVMARQHYIMICISVAAKRSNLSGIYNENNVLMHSVNSSKQ